MKQNQSKLKHHYSRSNFSSVGANGISHTTPFSKNDTQSVLINKVELPPKPKFFSDFVKEETEKIKKQLEGGANAGGAAGAIVPGNQQQEYGNGVQRLEEKTVNTRPKSANQAKPKVNQNKMVKIMNESSMLDQTGVELGD